MDSLSDKHSIWKTGPRGGLYRVTKGGHKVYKKESTKQKTAQCWKGYERVPGTKDYAKGSCRKKKMSRGYTFTITDNQKPCSPGKKKFAKRVNGKCIRYGDPNMTIKKQNPDRKRSFCARHQCHLKKDKATPGYQSCLAWDCNMNKQA